MARVKYFSTKTIDLKYCVVLLLGNVQHIAFSCYLVWYINVSEENFSLDNYLKVVKSYRNSFISVYGDLNETYASLLMINKINLSHLKWIQNTEI